MNPAEDKQCRNSMGNFWKDYLKVHLNIFINSIKFSRSFSTHACNNPRAENLCALLAAMDKHKET